MFPIHRNHQIVKPVGQRVTEGIGQGQVDGRCGRNIGEGLIQDLAETEGKNFNLDVLAANVGRR